MCSVQLSPLSLVMLAMLTATACQRLCAGSAYSVDVNNATAWSVGSGAGADSAVFFGFDYSGLGIPQAPGSSTTTAAVMWSNTNSAAASPQGITISPRGLTLTGDYIIRASVWLNSQPFNGIPPGANCTQMFGLGVGYAGGTLWSSGGTRIGSGVWFASSNDGDVGPVNTFVGDYSAFIGAGLVTSNDTYVAVAGGGGITVRERQPSSILPAKLSERHSTNGMAGVQN
jgi:hypothetical protein